LEFEFVQKEDIVALPADKQSFGRPVSDFDPEISGISVESCVSDGDDPPGQDDKKGQKEISRPAAAPVLKPRL
jgi:hypothetical protein